MSNKTETPVTGDINEVIKKAEDKIQQEFVMYYRNTFCLKHHSPRCMILSIPNEGAQAKVARLLMTGLYPGAGDTFVIHRWAHCQTCIDHGWIRSRYIFFEVKTPENTSGPKHNGQSESQIEFEEHCKQMGVEYHLVRSVDDVKRVLGIA